MDDTKHDERQPDGGKAEQEDLNTPNRAGGDLALLQRGSRPTEQGQE